MGLDLPVPFAFPHDLDIITVLSQGVLFLEGGFVNFLQGTICVTDGIPVTVLRKALGTPVPETSVEFVHGSCGGIVSVHQISVQHTHFTSVSDSADAITG